MKYSSDIYSSGSVGGLISIGLLLASTFDGNHRSLCHASSLASYVTVETGARYNLIPRRDTRNAQESSMTSNTESPMLISFDGDLDAIRAKAMAKANANHNGTHESFTCENETASHLEIVNWLYSIETVPQANVKTVYGEVSEITVDIVAPQSLGCYNNASAYANIVGIDSSIPGHEISTTGTCYIFSHYSMDNVVTLVYSWF
jgi:hypothetical protein